MRRFLTLVCFALLTVARASAQSEASIYVRLFPDTLAGPHARVTVMSLLDDPSWLNAVKNSIPVRLEWSVQLWQRGGFLAPSKAGPKAEWKETIQRNPTLDIYELRTSVPGERIPPQTFASLGMLALQVGRPWELADFGPKSRGKWYYRVTLRLSTLTDDEIAKLSNPDQGSVGRYLNKLLLGFTQPARTLTVESDDFIVR